MASGFLRAQTETSAQGIALHSGHLTNTLRSLQCRKRGAVLCTLTSPRTSRPQRQILTQLPQTGNSSRQWRPASQGPWINDMRPFLGHAEERIDAPPTARPIVVCPGFGNERNDYVSPGGRPELGIVARLQERGFRVEVMDLQRRDWARVLRSLLTREYWSRLCMVDPGYGWYLTKLREAVDLARLRHGCDQVTLLAHSAGGWLARAFLADERHFDASEAHTASHNRAVSSIVTLGSPHVAAPATARDMTGGALTWVNNSFPDAHFAEQGVRYACIAGCSVRGNGRARRRSLPRYSFSAYSQGWQPNHGLQPLGVQRPRAELATLLLRAGDSVVPNRSAFLKGADNVLLDGVFHSMGKIGSTGPSPRPWYGSEEVIDAWAGRLL